MNWSLRREHLEHRWLLRAVHEPTFGCFGSGMGLFLFSSLELLLLHRRRPVVGRVISPARKASVLQHLEKGKIEQLTQAGRCYIHQEYMVQETRKVLAVFLELVPLQEQDGIWSFYL